MAREGRPCVSPDTLRMDTERLFRRPLGIYTLSSLHKIFAAQAAAKGLGDGRFFDGGRGTDVDGSGFRHDVFHCASQTMKLNMSMIESVKKCV